MTTVRLLVGTTKGLFVYSSDEQRRLWRCEGPQLAEWEIYSALGDPKGEGVLAGASHAAYGPSVRKSDDGGATWTQIADGPRYPTETGFKFNRVWQLIPGHSSEPDTVFAGVEEAGLFVSRDRGATWSELDGLTSHPTRPGWFPGAGGMCLHTILIDPQDPRRMWVGISAAGVFRSEDGGETWTPRNVGLARVPTGQPYPDVGYCVHKMVLDPQDSNTLYMQEHGGVLRSTDGADSWEPIEDGLPSGRFSHNPDYSGPFGFPMAMSHNGDLFIAPLESSEQRTMAEGKLLIHRMERGADAWAPIGDASPEDPRYVGVLRDALAVDGLEQYGAYFGTTSGELYCSLDRGVTWDRLPGQLSRILAVKPWVVGANGAA